MQDKKLPPQLFSGKTEIIIGSFFEVMNELGSGFLEKVYKNALIIASAIPAGKVLYYFNAETWRR